MNTITRRDQSRGLTLQDEVNRLFDNFTRERSGHAELATWAPAVDIYETENELVVKADLPDPQDKDIDVRIANNTLTIRGERKFEKDVEENCLRIERTYSRVPVRKLPCRIRLARRTFGPSTAMASSTLHMAKREESSRSRSRSASGKRQVTHTDHIRRGECYLSYRQPRRLP